MAHLCAMHPLAKKVETRLQMDGLHQSENTALVGLSGGADSIALCLVLHQLGWDILAAHVNYGLRGEESDADELFVRQFCAKKGIALEVKKVDTHSIAESEKKGIQEVAREIRYTWFRELANKVPGTLIATGHHADDQAETVLFQLIRGSGIKGLTGMKPFHNGLIRPLLEIRRSEIENFLREFGETWRTDSSNLNDQYLRNFIRHKLLPITEQVNEKAVEHILHTSQIAEEYRILAEAQMNAWIETHCIREKDTTKIPIHALAQHPQKRSLIFFLLEKAGYSSGALNDVLHLMDGITGKTVLSESHEITRDREFLVLRRSRELQNFYLEIKSKEESNPHLHFQEVALPIDFTGVSKNEIFVDAKKVQFPLVLRTWKEGDRISPLGMKGQQKVSDLLIQSKVAIYEKPNVLVLESGGKILWVLGYRVSEEFKLDAHSQAALHIKAL